MARVNKTQIQAKKRGRHTKQIDKNKIKNVDPLLRASATISERKSFLIVCEGKNTEPSYFKLFKIPTAKIHVLGEGYNTTSLVKRAGEILHEHRKKGLEYDEVWCVFDKDDFPSRDFNTAITNAENQGFKVAYSNQSFEYWIFLHFNDHQGGKLNRNDCCAKINGILKDHSCSYDNKGSKKIENDLFDLMLAPEKSTDKKTRVRKAVDRAKKGYKKFDHKSPANEESSTTVFLLVEKLLALLNL